jgi:predicted nucleic acid binding AN1-type Zn finger protein
MSVEEIKKNNICAFQNCNKKIKITDFACKCEKYYCKYHKDPLNHDCSYNYKENNNKQKLIENMECKSIKLLKI